MDAKNLEIKISGKEKASFLRRETEHYHESGERKSRQVTRKEKCFRNLIDVKAHCFTFGSQLMPGDYTVPFEFTIPSHLPASIMYQNRQHTDKPKAFIAYYVKAKIENHDRTYLKYKQMLVLHEPPVAFKQDEQHRQTVGITTCCCFDQGKTGLLVQFDKNVFFSNEIAKANVSVDNRECNLKISEIEF
jgi:hypothetical protein